MLGAFLFCVYFCFFCWLITPTRSKPAGMAAQPTVGQALELPLTAFPQPEYVPLST
jgi:hypothetical protein